MSLADDFDSVKVPTQPTQQAGKSLAADFDATPSVHAKAESQTATGSDYENFMAGAGKAVTDLGRGVKQLADMPAKWLENQFPGISEFSQTKLGMPSAASSAAETQKNIDEAKQLDKPLMNTTAGQAGNIAGNIASVVIPASGLAKGAEIAGDAGLANAARAFLNPSTYSGATAAGAMQGAIQPVATGDSRLNNTVLGAGGGALGQGVANTVGAVAQPTAKILSDAHSKAVQVLQDAGVPLDAAQLSGSAFLGKIKSALFDNPFTAGTQKEMAANQQQAFNKAVLNTMGEDSKAATSDVMGAAKSRIGAIYDDVASRNNIKFDDTFQNNLANIETNARNVLNDQQFSVIKRNLDDVVNKASSNDGIITGKQYQNIKQTLDKITKGDPQTAQFAKDMRSTLTDGLQRSAAEAGNQSDVALLQQANKQYGNMKTIENAIVKDGSGDISPAILSNTLYTKANRNASIYGNGKQELVDLAQAGKMLLGDKNPNSGTIARMAMQAAPAVLMGGADYAYNGDLIGAAKVAGGVYALPKVAQMAINNPSVAKYLSQGIPQTSLKDLMLSPQNNDLIGGAVKRLPLAYIGAEK